MTIAAALWDDEHISGLAAGVDRLVTRGDRISCLMVALPNPARFARQKRSLADYCRQSHQNRELVLVMNGGSKPHQRALRDYAVSLGRTDIRIIEPAGELTLGALRNISREAATGDIVCQWDDDDLYHPERLARQLEFLDQTGGQAVCLQEMMQFFPASRRLYSINWRATDDMGLAGSLMCFRSAPIRYPETGPNARLGEDSVVVSQLRAAGGYHVLPGFAHLYVYVSHGANSYSDLHHSMLAESLGLTKGLLRRRETQIRQGAAAHDFGPGPIIVQGANGPAFTIE